MAAQITSQLSEFNEDTWAGQIGSPKALISHVDIFDLEEVEKNKTSEESDFQLMSDCGWFCGTLWLTVTTSGGQLISIVIECDPQTWVYECSVPTGSGLEHQPGEEPECEDPTMPCYDGPGGPVQVDECEWMMSPPPGMCGQPEECDTNDPILDDYNVQLGMYEAWLASYGPNHAPLDQTDRRERMFIVTVTSSGYEVEEIPPGPNTSPCHFDGGNVSIPSNCCAFPYTSVR